MSNSMQFLPKEWFKNKEEALRRAAELTKITHKDHVMVETSDKPCWYFVITEKEFLESAKENNITIKEIEHAITLDEALQKYAK